MGTQASLEVSTGPGPAPDPAGQMGRLG